MRAQSELGDAVDKEWRVSPSCRPPYSTITPDSCLKEATLVQKFEDFDKCCSWMPGALNRSPTVERIALFHYATKSWEDFSSKMKRGSGMSKSTKTLSYFQQLEQCAPNDCQALHLKINP
jgi:hypothetical protein